MSKTEPQRLHSLYVGGFKSFAYSEPRRKGDGEAIDYHGRRVEFGDITVLLGANGAGKSNIVSLFKMCVEIANRRLPDFVALHGGAESLLHFGSRTTPTMEVLMEFDHTGGWNSWTFVLADAAPDRLVLKQQRIERTPGERTTRHSPAPHEVREGPQHDADLIPDHIRQIKVYQFHDTSPTARIRKSCYIEDGHQLRGDAGNLAAFLVALKTNHGSHYEVIRRTIQHACPQFDDFELAPSPLDATSILLNWRSREQPDYLMGPHQLSDGTLRFMALATLLLQPTSMLPSTIVIDEPELGLHPTAIGILAGLVKQAAVHSQVILATQSPTLVDHFDLAQIRAMQHTNGSSTFLDLKPAELEHWLDRYTLGEMWQKNLFRAGPEHG